MTVVRELQEELGLIADGSIEAPLMITCTPIVGLTAGHVDVSLWYVVHARRNQPLKFDRTEFTAATWFKFSKVPVGRSEPHLERFIEKFTMHSLPRRTRAN
jgi:8-oxo-dGTP diphosphatase